MMMDGNGGDSGWLHSSIADPHHGHGHASCFILVLGLGILAIIWYDVEEQTGHVEGQVCHVELMLLHRAQVDLPRVS